jgi:glutaredoxin 3
MLTIVNKETKMAVTVYSTESCPWCAKTKAFLKENKVAFKNVDVGKDKEAAKKMIEKSGQMGVPVTDVNGTIIIGFDEGKLKKALKL